MNEISKLLERENEGKKDGTISVSTDTSVNRQPHWATKENMDA